MGIVMKQIRQGYLGALHSESLMNKLLTPVHNIILVIVQHTLPVETEASQNTAKPSQQLSVITDRRILMYVCIND